MGQHATSKSDRRNILFAGIIIKIIGFLYRIPLTNLLGDEGQGYLSLALELYILFLLLSSYAMNDTMSSFISDKLRDGRNVKEAFLKALIPAAVYSLLIALIFYALSDRIASHLLGAPYTAYPMRVLAPAIFLFSISQCLRGYFNGIGAYTPSLISRILEQIFVAFVALFGAASYLRTGRKLAEKEGVMAVKSAIGARGAALGTLVGVICGLLFLIFVFVSHEKKVRRKKAFRHEYVRLAGRDLFAKVLPMILGILAVNLQGPMNALFYSRIASVQGTATRDIVIRWGLYDAKCGVWLRLPVGIAVTAGLLTLNACEGARSQDRSLSEAFRNSLLIAVIGAVTLFVFGGALIECFYHGNVKLPAHMIRLSAVSVILYTLGVISSTVLKRMGEEERAVKIAGISLLVHLAMLIVLLVFFKAGIFAVIGATLISGFVFAFINLRIIEQRSRYRLNVVTFILKPLLEAFIAAVPSLVVYGVIRLVGRVEWATFFGILIWVIWLPVRFMRRGILKPEDMKKIPFGDQLYRFLKQHRWL